MYDQKQCYVVLQEHEERQRQPLEITIPPQRGATLWQNKENKVGSSKPSARDDNIRRIKDIGRRRWKRESGYYRQSKAESTMFRYKNILGDKLKARKLERQGREVFIGCVALNRMTELGMPDYHIVS